MLRRHPTLMTSLTRLDETVSVLFAKDDKLTEKILNPENSAYSKERDSESKSQIKTRRWQTLSYCLNYFALGLAVGCTGPTLLALEEITSSETHDMTWVFAARGIAWIFGSIIAAKLYSKLRGNRILWISLLAMALSMFLIPLLHFLWGLLIVTALSGIVMSWIEVGVNTLTLWVWKDKVGPYMQLLHFAFGFGLSASPFIVAGVMLFISKAEGQLMASYWLMGLLIVITALFPLKFPSPPIESEYVEPENHFTKVKSSEGLQETQYTFEENNGNDGIAPKQKKWDLRTLFLISLIVVFLFLYGGAENAFGGWVSTYAQEEYNFSEAEAAYLNSAYWGALTIGRFLAVPLAARVSGKILLVSDIVGCCICLLLLLIYGHMHLKWLLWLVTIAFGLSMAPIFATAFTIPAELQIKVSSTAASAFIVASGIGDMILPIVVGTLLHPELLGETALLWSVLLVFVICLILYFVMFAYGVSTMDKRIDVVELEGLGDSWE